MEFISKNKRYIFLSLVSLSILGIFCLYSRATTTTSKKPDPKISVVLPIYNVEKYLPKCLDSILDQESSVHEIICVNDGSYDKSLEILKEYAAKNDKIKVINKENGGVSSARNAGIEACTGEYIHFFDPDDWIDSNVYEKCIETITNTGAEIVVFDYIDEPSGKEWTLLENKTYDDPFKAVKDTTINSGYIWNKIFKKSLMVDNNIFYKEDIKYGEDNLFVNMILAKSKLTVTLPKFYYHYLSHEDSSGNSVSYEKRVADSIKRCRYLVDFYIENEFKNNLVFVLDYCLCITKHYRLNIPEIDKFYASVMLELIESKLLDKIPHVPENLNKLVKELREFSS